MNMKRVSKFLSLILRHKPETIGLELDPEGWLNVEEIIEGAAAKGMQLSRELISEIVRTSDKQRFKLSEDGERIRANQGHTIHVDMQFETPKPPRFLYHGTAKRNLEAIKKEGLKSMQRQHVHLARNRHIARSVGVRHDQEPVILGVDTQRVQEAGITLSLSENHVWLADAIPPRCLFADKRYTNRRFYQDLLDLLRLHEVYITGLELFLRSFWGQCEKWRQSGYGLSIDVLLYLIDQALLLAPENYDPAWEKVTESDEAEEYEYLRETLLTQIVDLRQMEAVGTLENEYRYFGVDAPSGRRWYNFDVKSYVECAAVGSFGGWTEEANPDRQLVDGEVAILTSGGEIGSSPAEDIPNEEYPLGEMSWEDVGDFLNTGRCYE
jgi:putative RNA 2'-phosphotransferase